MNPSLRFRAFTLHLLASAFVGGAAALYVSQVWYPTPLLTLMGGLGIFMIIVCVDIVLGPAITLVIANPGKSRRALTVDYTIVGLLQLAALAYGLYTLAIARPAFIVFAKDGFVVTRANEHEASELAEAKLPEFQSLSIARPKWALAELPDNTTERNKIILEAGSGGRDFWGYPKYYRALDGKVVAAAALPISELRKVLPPGAKLEIDYVSPKGSRDESSLGFVSFIGKTQAIAAVVDRSSGEVIGYVWHTPWK